MFTNLPPRLLTFAEQLYLIDSVGFNGVAKLISEYAKFVNPLSQVKAPMFVAPANTLSESPT